MILHDRLEVTQRIVVGTDDYGNDRYEDVNTMFPAEVRPLFSSETVAAGSQVQSRYRVFLPAAAFDVATTWGSVTWRGRDYEIEGDVEPHSKRGRLHHIEFLIHRTTG